MPIIWDLKEFCDKYDLDFPTIVFQIDGFYVKTIIWYGREVYVYKGDGLLSTDDVISYLFHPTRCDRFFAQLVTDHQNTYPRLDACCCKCISGKRKRQCEDANYCELRGDDDLKKQKCE